MTRFIFILFMWFTPFIWSQCSDTTVLFEKSAQHFGNKDYTPAKYYLELGLKKCPVLLDSSHVWQTKLWKIDSIIAYDIRFNTDVDLLTEADSAYKVQDYKHAFILYNKINTNNNHLSYPLYKMDSVIVKFPKAAEMIKTAYANILRAESKTLLDSIEKTMTSQPIHAYFLCRNYLKSHNNDERFIALKKKITENYFDAFQVNFLFNKCEENLKNEDYPEALTGYKKIKAVYPPCEECTSNMEFISLILKKESWDENRIESEIKSAIELTESGDYYDAYLKLAHLGKLFPERQDIQDALEVTLNNLDTLQSEEKAKKSAQLLLEQANDLFMKENYELALKKYLKLQNNYLEFIDYEAFLELRIEECKANL